MKSQDMINELRHVQDTFRNSMYVIRGIVKRLEKESCRAVNLIEIPEEKRVEVLTILLENGNFRSLNKTTFEIENNLEETIKKIRDKGIEVKRI